jgi:hypothetical protein
MDSRKEIKVGDEVRCKARGNHYYDYEGIVSEKWSDNQFIVGFKSISGISKTFMVVDSLELIYEEEIEWIAEKK